MKMIEEMIGWMLPVISNLVGVMSHHGWNLVKNDIRKNSIWIVMTAPYRKIFSMD